MYIEVLVVLLGIIATLGVFFYQRKKYRKVSELLLEALLEDRMTFIETLDKLRASLVGELHVKRQMIEDDLFKTIKEHNEQIEASNIKADEFNVEKLEQVNKSIANSVEVAQKEYSRMEGHFRENTKEDPAQHLMACAYAVVSKGHEPRDITDAELTKAVLSHRKAAGPSLLLQPKGAKLPDSGSLN